MQQYKTLSSGITGFYNFGLPLLFILLLTVLLFLLVFNAFDMHLSELIVSVVPVLIGLGFFIFRINRHAEVAISDDVLWIKKRGKEIKIDLKEIKRIRYNSLFQFDILGEVGISFKYETALGKSVWFLADEPKATMKYLKQLVKEAQEEKGRVF